MKRPIQVTRSNKPSMFKYFFYSLQMFRSRQFTNSGKFEKKLETKLSLRFNCPHVILMANGTLPLIFLLSQLPKGSTVLTTPFSFIATTSSAMFSGLSVEYVDIDPITLMPSGGAVQDILESKAISAILITQVYGRNEGIREIEAIAKEFDVPFYVDASHSFDVYDDLGTSIYTVGDAATSSFHATKLFSTAEGGAIFTRSPEIARKAQIWKNFGFDNGGISSIGVNAKMSELSAIFGLASIGKVDREMARRKRLVKTYKNSIGIDKVEFVNSPNNSYFPVIFPSHEKNSK
jgi:dTDP-4-amino-4,6-dideoxygalactose transaminase